MQKTLHPVARSDRLSVRKSAWQADCNR